MSLISLTSKLKIIQPFNRIISSQCWSALSINSAFTQNQNWNDTAGSRHYSTILKTFPNYNFSANNGILPSIFNLKAIYNTNRGSLQFKEIIRHNSVHHVNRPSPQKIRTNLRYKVHYPEDGEYTIQPLPMTKLGGRDPETGRLIHGKIGGGHKRKYRWVIFNRVPPGGKDPLIERVIHIQYDPNQTARIALVGHDDKLRFIIATTSMKKGDLITSTRELPRMPIRAKEGDAHPIGALTLGTRICCIEKVPGEGASVKLAGGTSAIVSRRLKDKYVVQMDSRIQFALDPKCLVTVGQVSNPNHPKLVIGSAQRARWLGIRPSSGLWQRKSGRHGFKSKRPPPVKHFEAKKPPPKMLDLTISGILPGRRIIPATNRVT